MADKTPLSSGGLFQTRASLYDSQAGYPSRELDTDLVIRRRGSNQNLVHEANHHDGQDTRGPRANKVQDGQVPRTSGPVLGRPTRAQPLGQRSGESLIG